MKIIPLDAVNEDDVQLHKHHPAAKWVIGWQDEHTDLGSFDNEKRVRLVAEGVCKHPFHMRAMYTYIAFNDYEDAMLTYLAL